MRQHQTERDEGVVPELSIVIPCYNEAESLPHTLETLLPALESAVGERWRV